MKNIDLKILLISPLPPPEGGIASWTKSYMNFCSSVGVTANVINIALTGKRQSNINNKRNFVDEILRTRAIFSSLLREIRHNKPDIIHINSSCGKFGIIRDYLVTLISKILQIPILIHFHCNIEDQISSKLSRFILRKIVKKSNKVVVLNQTSKKYINEVIKAEAVILPNFISQGWVKANNKKISPTINKILFVGHINSQKGIEEIFQVAKKLSYIKFILVGPIESKYKNIKLPDNIEFVGSVPSNIVKEYYDSVDVFLFPTHSEGFSIALVEAMSRGLPIITTPVGANVDMIEKNGGLIVPVGNINEIKKAIEKLNNAQIRENMSEWNINKVKHSYTVEKVMRELFEIYREVSIR